MHMWPDGRTSVKVIFLDFDNVLHHVKWRNKGLPFDPACTARVSRIIHATQADVVVSSSWRNNRRYATDAERLAHLRGLLDGAGVEGEVIDFTPIVEPKARAIGWWLKAHPNVSRYVVLDDDVTACVTPETFIRTSCLTGVTDEDVAQAIAILSV